jgi:hypothetical protein
MEKEKMRRSLERRLAALEARVRDAAPADRLLTPCTCRQDACSEPPNACSFDDVSPADRPRVVDLQGWRACSARRSSAIPFTRIIAIDGGIAADRRHL